MKTCILPPPPKSTQKEVKTKKPPQKRVVTSDRRWTFSETDLDHENQLKYIDQIRLNMNTPDSEENHPVLPFIRQQIANKIGGYKYQDITKNIYSESQFLDFATVIQLLHDSGLTCFYCLKPVSVVYEYVRESTQWTIERIDNTRGHNCDNSEIACLGCNISRRTMYHERYVFTKQLRIVKKMGDT